MFRISLNLLIFTGLTVFFTISACQCSKKNTAANVEAVINEDINLGVEQPINLIPIDVEIRDINCYFEYNKFNVVGMVSNKTMKWQRVFLKVYFLDADKSRIKVGGREEIYIPVNCEVIPPAGQSSFSWSFDATALAATPAECDVKLAGAKIDGERLQLTLADDIKNLGIESPDPGNPSAPVVVGTLITTKVYNPFDVPVENPKAQFVIYGKDNKIWYVSTVAIDSTEQFFQVDHSGPVKPKEERFIGGSVKHSALPAELQKVGIGQVLILPFSAGKK